MKTKKGFLAVFILCLLLGACSLPTKIFAEQTNVSYGYTRPLGSNTWDDFAHVVNIRNDENDNLYMVGQYYGTIDFDPTSGTDSHTSGIAGVDEAYVTKINANGTYGWTKVFTGSRSYGADVAFDSNDNPYIAVQVSGTVDLNPGAGTANHTTGGLYDTAIIKLDTNGNYLDSYVSTGTGSSIVYAYAIAIDSNNNIYQTGRLKGTVDFDPSGSTDTKTSGNSGNAQNIYVTKINSNGTYGDTRVMSGVGDSTGFAIGINSDNAVYVAGRYYDTVDFNPGAGIDSVAGNALYQSAFLTKFESDGTYDWTKTYGNVGGTEDAYATVLVVGSDNGVYVSGGFSGTVDFDPSGAADSHSSNGSADFYMTKFDADGGHSWTKTIGNASYDGGSIALDSNNNVYAYGSYTGTVDFDPSAGVDNKTSVASDFYLTKIKSDGTYDTTYTTSMDSGGYVYTDGNDVSVDSTGSIYYAGVYSGTMDFNPLSGVDSHTNAQEDSFVTQINQTTYQQITGLDSSLSAKTLSAVDATDNNILNGTSTTIRLSKSDDTPVADVTTSFAADLDWSMVTADSDAVNGKAFTHNLVSADGTASSFTLYVPKLNSDDGVGICPGAASLAAVSKQCEGLYYLKVGTDNNISSVTIDGGEYWKITGLTGTGGFSTVVPVSASSNTTAGSSDELAPTGSSLTALTVSGCLLLIGGAGLSFWQRRRL